MRLSVPVEHEILRYNAVGYSRITATSTSLVVISNFKVSVSLDTRESSVTHLCKLSMILAVH